MIKFKYICSFYANRLCLVELERRSGLALLYDSSFQQSIKLTAVLCRLGYGTRRAFLTELVRNKTKRAAEDANRSLSQLFSEGTVIYKVET